MYENEAFIALPRCPFSFRGTYNVMMLENFLNENNLLKRIKFKWRITKNGKS
jgi:hypothetical protein